MLNDQSTSSDASDLEYFIICGLGSLGQHCIVSLAEFEVKIIAIEKRQPIEWEIESLRALLDNLIIGDCRYNDILSQAMIHKCRAALIVTTDERVNVETARLVVLATIEGLRRIEQGQLNWSAKQWQIRIERALTRDAVFEGANAIARITGSSLALARKTMNQLPQTECIPVMQ